MGMAPSLPRRRSVEDTSSRRSLFGHAGTLDADDFADVFGGPPRSVLQRKFSGDFSNSNGFYEEIFRKPEFVTPVTRGGRSLPAFRIPARSDGFYSDIFGSDDDRRRSRERSRPTSKAKSNSSSALSSEELSPLRPVIGDDVALSSFASKLRPISVPARWNSSTMMTEEYPKKQGNPAFPCNLSSYTENQFMENEYHENFRTSYSGFRRQVSSPETISLEPNSYGSVKISVDDPAELNSSSSAVSSLHQDLEPESGIQDHEFPEQEDDEVMSSYVIEINSYHREGTCGETVSVDEAIAWAKEKFQAQSSEKDLSMRQCDNNEQPVEIEGRPNPGEFSDQAIDGHRMIQSTEEEEQRNWTAEEEKQQSEKYMEVELLDECIRLWSAGKETNIKILLSKLHHILWPNSGWCAIPLTSLTESSQVKKAYQKARLCLHPDKLQQRGATLPQKYVAEKAFSILQDAWAAFISQDVFLN